LAQYSHRKTNDENVVMLGEQAEYEPLSRAAFYKAMLKQRLPEIDINDPEPLNDSTTDS
jgi:thymidine kinase